MALLYSASVHYFRTPRDQWKQVLDRLESAGIQGVDVYVPWSVHEMQEGRYDFGDDPALDLPAFVDMVDARGMWLILRPGPQVNAELNNFGLPDRIVRDSRCQAHGPRGKPVFCPNPPVFFPVPSYGSPAYLEEATAWLRAVAEALGDRIRPTGPIRMVQVDNEASLFFRDAPFDQDYRPEVVARWHDWLGEMGMDDREPPVRRGPDREDLVTATLWVRFRQHVMVEGLRQMKTALVEAGLSEQVMAHNTPPSGLWLPVRPSRLASVVDVVATDIYSSSRSTALVRDQVLMHRGQEAPPFSAELGCGTVFFAPRIGPFDNRFVTLVALAHGLAGFNLYMGAGRDRWIGGLVPEGRPDRGADLLHFYQRLIRLLSSIHHEALRVQDRAVLVVPDEYADHSVASFPVPGASPTLLAALGIPVHEMLVTQTWGLESAVQRDWLKRLRACQDALDAGDTPYVIRDGTRPLPASTVAFAPTFDYLSPQVLRTLLEHAESGHTVVMGPREPATDQYMVPLEETLLDRMRAARESGQLMVVQQLRDERVIDLLKQMLRQLGQDAPWELSIRAPSVKILPHRSEDGRLWASWLIASGGGPGQRTVLGARKGWSYTHALALRENGSSGEFINKTGGPGSELVLETSGRQVNLIIWRRDDVQ